ncbi:MAG: hypothetical protein QXT13_10155 [Pyrobaculum sp.]
MILTILAIAASVVLMLLAVRRGDSVFAVAAFFAGLLAIADMFTCHIPQQGSELVCVQTPWAWISFSAGVATTFAALMIMIILIVKNVFEGLWHKY